MYPEFSVTFPTESRREMRTDFGAEFFRVSSSLFRTQCHFEGTTTTLTFLFCKVKKLPICCLDHCLLISSDTQLQHVARSSLEEARSTTEEKSDERKEKGNFFGGGKKEENREVEKGGGRRGRERKKRCYLNPGTLD